MTQMAESEHTPGRLPNFCLDKGVRWCLESDSNPPSQSHHQGTRELRHAVIGGFTAKGGLAVITNQLGVVAKTLISVRLEMAPTRGRAHDNTYAHPSAFLVNGMLASAATGLQNVLDAVASLCHHLQPDSEHQGIVYFSTYRFSVTTWAFIAEIKRNEIDKLRFHARSFNDMANGLKHEMPWIGVISEVNGKLDVYDEAGVGVFLGLLVPMYNITKKIVQRMGRTSFLDVQTSELRNINQAVDLPCM